MEYQFKPEIKNVLACCDGIVKGRDRFQILVTGIDHRCSLHRTGSIRHLHDLYNHNNMVTILEMLLAFV